MKTFCAYYNQGTCRSCEMISIDYDDQIRLKEENLIKELNPLQFPQLLPTVTSSPAQFRNKVKLSVTGTSDNPIIGLLGEDNFDAGREILNCPLHLKKINEVLPKIKMFITLAKLIPYQISSKNGELKGLIIFFSEKSSEMYLRFVCRSKESMTRIQKYLPSLMTEVSELKSVSMNIQPTPHAILEGEEEISLTANASINYHLAHLKLTLNPKAFTQTNQQISEKLYATAANWISDLKIDKFLELFCGQGAFSFFSAPFIQEGLGIEINSSAVIQANETAQNLNLHHLHFKCADAQNVLDDIKKFNPSLLLVNPPRRGLGESIQIIKDQRPPFIIYSSCSYQTLAKDLKTLDAFYQIKKIQIFDMFPHTAHFETLLLLKRRSLN